MLDENAEFKTLLVLYADGPPKLKAALTGLTDNQFDLAPDAQSWSIRQIAHHIVDGDELWKTCILAILGNQQGFFSLQWYWDVPQNQWADCWNYAGRPVESALERFRINREHILELIERTPQSWNKAMRIHWPNRPESTILVSDVIEMQARHVLGHIEDIYSILKTIDVNLSHDLI